MSKTPQKNMPEKVVLEKTGTHVKVTAGPYTKRQLRQLLLSSLSLLSGNGEREAELMRLSGVEPDDVRRLMDGQIFGDDGQELFEEGSKKSAILRLVELISNEEKRDLEDDLINLLRGKGMSEDLINRILTYGLTDETIRLLKLLGFTDEEIAQLLEKWQTLDERRSKSEVSCLSVQSSEEDMTIEGFYLMSSFKNLLTKALTDIIGKKPYNPTEYLGHWLLNYKVCEERAKKQKEFDAELQAERERRRIKVNSEPEDLNREDGILEGELVQDWNFIEFEAD